MLRRPLARVTVFGETLRNTWAYFRLMKTVRLLDCPDESVIRDSEGEGGKCTLAFRRQRQRFFDGYVAGQEGDKGGGEGQAGRGVEEGVCGVMPVQTPHFPAITHPIPPPRQ